MTNDEIRDRVMRIVAEYDKIEPEKVHYASLRSLLICVLFVCFFFPFSLSRSCAQPANLSRSVAAGKLVQPQAHQIQLDIILTKPHLHIN